MRKLQTILVALTLMVALLAGGMPALAEGAAEQAINTYLVEEPKTVDPSLSSDSVGGEIIMNTMDALTRLVSDGEGGYTFAPAGAASWESNENGTVWTFHLNENKWSDGVPVTAMDYEFALKRTADPATGAPLVDMINPLLNFDAVISGEMDPQELGVKALDEKTLEITLTSPVPFFLSLTYDRVFAPQRQDLLAEYGEKFGSEAQYSISNGPFMFDSWVHNSQIVLVKNPEYWDADSVKLEKITYNIMTDQSTYLSAFESGELDLVTVPDLEWRDRFQKVEGVQFFAVPTATITYSFFNTIDPVFQNENIRRAFMFGTNREELNALCFGSLRVPTYGWVVPSITVGEINYRATVGDTIQELAAQYPEPRELLVQGMQELGLGDDPATLDVTFSLAGTSDWYQTLGAYLQQAYKTSLGINLKLEFNEWGIFYDNVQRGDFQIGFMAWGAFYNDPYDVLSLFVSTSNAIMTSWGNAEYDALMAQAMTEMDDAARLELYAQAERIMLESAAANPLACAIQNRFIQGHVKNVSPSTFGTEGFKFVYIEK